MLCFQVVLWPVRAASVSEHWWSLHFRKGAFQAREASGCVGDNSFQGLVAWPYCAHYLNSKVPYLAFQV